MSTPPIPPVPMTPMDYDSPDSLRDNMERATWLEFAGILQLVAAFAVYKGARWAVVLAVVTVFFNAVAHLSAAKTYPVWSITIVVLDVVIMYGLVVHSGRKAST